MKASIVYLVVEYFNENVVTVTQMYTLILHASNVEILNDIGDNI